MQIQRRNDKMEILNIPMAIVHVFFIPMISMLVYYRRNKKALELNGEFLVRYGIYTSVVVTIAKVIASVILKVTDIRLKIDSTYFAVIAICVAFFLPYIAEVFKKNVEIKCEIKSSESGGKNE